MDAIGFEYLGAMYYGTFFKLSPPPSDTMYGISTASNATQTYVATSTAAVPDLGFPIFSRFWTLGVILSSIAYGIVFTLFAACIYLLRKSLIESRKRVHYFLCAYITSMFALSTISIVSGISANLNGIETQQVPSNLLTGANSDAVVTILAFWASDGFLLWRASVLYKGVSTVKRHIIYCLISFLVIAQLVTGIMYLISSFVASMQIHARPIFVAFGSTTLCVNWVITGLIVVRLLVVRAKTKRTLGNANGLPYIGIISMCIESAALVIIFATIFLSLNLLNLDPFTFARAFLIHIYVIAPLLTIYRVAQGKAFITDTDSFYNHNFESSHRPGTGSMHFSRHASTTLSTTLSTPSPARVEINISQDEFRRVDTLTRSNHMELDTKRAHVQPEQTAISAEKLGV